MSFLREFVLQGLCHFKVILLQDLLNILLTSPYRVGKRLHDLV